MTQVVLATGNAGKLRELASLLTGSGIELTAQAALSIAAQEETGLTFVENALLKARHACRQSGLPAIADDSGLEVDALEGAPGIYSARYSGKNVSDVANVQKLLWELSGVPVEKRTARFRCVLVFLRRATDPAPLICQGVWEGRILDAPRGNNGFGYDPVFLVPEKNRSAAELSAEEKNRLSHRGQALRALATALMAADPQSR